MLEFLCLMDLQSICYLNITLSVVLWLWLTGNTFDRRPFKFRDSKFRIMWVRADLLRSSSLLPQLKHGHLQPCRKMSSWMVSISTEDFMTSLESLPDCSEGVFSCVHLECQCFSVCVCCLLPCHWAALRIVCFPLTHSLPSGIYTPW